MRKTINIAAVFLLILSILPAAYAAGTTTLMEQARQKLLSVKSITAAATIAADGHTSHASITAAGKAFTIKMPQMEIWYDGTTQWTYNPNSGETSVTTPTPQEIAQINPLSLIASIGDGYKTTQLPSGNSTEQTVRLLPRHPNPDLAYADVTLNSRTAMPTQIILTDPHGNTITLTVTSIKTGQALPSSTFRYDKAAHPSATVVDLR